jgi:hypothetical protein
MNRLPKIILVSLSGLIATASLLIAWPVHADSDRMVSRDYGWHSETLALDVPAHVHFQRSPLWHLTIRGPEHTLDRLEVSDGKISARSEHGLFGFFDFFSGHRFRSVDVDLSGPELRDVRVNGSGNLQLGNLSQDALKVRIEGSGSLTGSGIVGDVDVRIEGSGHVRLTQLEATKAVFSISGSGWVEGSGTAGDLDVNIDGSGHIRLSELRVTNAQVSISGSGNVAIAPTGKVSARIAGSGRVRLYSHPQSLSWHVAGSGSVVEVPAATRAGS